MTPSAPQWPADSCTLETGRPSDTFGLQDPGHLLWMGFVQNAEEANRSKNYRPNCTAMKYTVFRRPSKKTRLHSLQWGCFWAPLDSWISASCIPGPAFWASNAATFSSRPVWTHGHSGLGFHRQHLEVILDLISKERIFSIHHKLFFKILFIKINGLSNWLVIRAYVCRKQCDVCHVCTKVMWGNQAP